jgi:hypothetical protein
MGFFLALPASFFDFAIDSRSRVRMELLCEFEF